MASKTKLAANMVLKNHLFLGAPRKTVSEILCENIKDLIGYLNNIEDRRSIMVKSNDICGIPRVIGAVYGTLISIKNPSEEGHLFVSRKGFHALNAQIVVDTDLVFRDVVSSFSGSTHDAYIWRNWNLYQRLSDGEFRNSWVLGDNA